MVEPGEDQDRFSDDEGASIVGFVINAKPGGVETVNCRATAEIDRDTHIELALSRGAPEIERVIVEVTPRWRAKMKEQGIDWSTPALHDSLIGHMVRITGWVFNDWEHKGQSENTNPGGAHNWRATTWEIQPTTAIEILE